MICEKCGCEYEGKYCPNCRKNAVNAGIVAVAKAFAYSLFFVGIQFIIQLAFVIVQAFIAALSGAGDLDMYDQIVESLYANVCKMTILSSLVTILAVGVIFLARRLPIGEQIRLKPVVPRTLGLIALFGAALQVVISVTVDTIPWPQSWLDALLQVNDFLLSESLLLQILAVVILGPITEELIFRGLVHTRLRRAFPPLVAALLSGVAFGIVHGNMIQFFYAAALGVVLGLVMERYNSLLPCILIHIVFNGTSFLVTLIPSAAVLIPVYLVCVAVVIFCAYRIWFKKNDVKNGKETPDEAV